MPLSRGALDRDCADGSSAGWTAQSYEAKHVIVPPK
jgi:hypothetical protein